MTGEEPTGRREDDPAAFRRYLRAKRTVDDRALDRRLVGILGERLADRAAATDGPLRVLEVGAGIGTMIARLIDWEVLPPGEIRYVAVDRDAGTLAGLGPFLRAWAADREASVSVADAATEGETSTVTVETDAHAVTVEPVAADAIAYAEANAGEWDAMIGMALLDVLDLEGLETLLGALAPGGTYYFPITFDGGTRFRPSHPADRMVERRYHAHMDAKPGGSSRAGGDALSRLRDIEGASLVGVAGSDWVVRPTVGSGRLPGPEAPTPAGEAALDDAGLPSDEAYPGDEAYFLRHILDTVEGAVGEVIDGTAGGPSVGGPSTDTGDPAAALAEWVACRRQEVDGGELVYLTHQLDLLGRIDPAE
ncbi:hypothetical protein [Halorubrum sp. FL23]|uniref:hypothetical protein n=1 Tax=Halorubrum sp. FL23 TaxID=3458704 RepID=UPI004034EB50